MEVSECEGVDVVMEVEVVVSGWEEGTNQPSICWNEGDKVPESVSGLIRGGVVD